MVPDRLFGRIEGLFRDMGWDVVTLKYGRKLEAAFTRTARGAARLGSMIARTACIRR